MANDEQNSKAKLISDCYIKPKYVLVPRENRPCFNLLAMELFLLSMDYMQRGFLFSKKPAAVSSEYLDKLKNSLSYALDYYYPLAGRFVTVRYEDEKACSIYVDPEKGPGARFIHASAAVSASDVASYSADVLPVVRSFFELGETGVIDYDGHTRALVSMQVTELDDGMFIGFTMNHSVADGTSLWHFIGSLSEIFNSLDEKMTLTTTKISRIPVFKPVLPPGYSLIQKLPFLELPEEYRGRAEVDDQLLEKSFHFSAASLARLKEQANDEVLSIGLGKTMQISSFQALAAHVWISINRVRDAPFDQPTTCFVPVDSRARFNPPLSSDHFGALVHAVWPTQTVGELMEKGLGWTAAQIHEAITTYNEEAVMSTLKTFMDRPFVLPVDEPSKSSDKQKPSLVRFAGSMRFDVYRPEFGLGKAIAVRTGYSGKIDGKVTMNMSREGGGSVDLEVCLSSDNMLSLEFDENFMSSTS